MPMIDVELNMPPLPDPVTVDDKHLLPNALYEVAGEPQPKGTYSGSTTLGVGDLGDDVTDLPSLDLGMPYTTAFDSMNLQASLGPAWWKVLLVGVGVVFLVSTVGKR